MADPPTDPPAPLPIDPSADLVPRPASGRVFAGARPVRLADVSPGGRLRLDACARYLQDVSSDDTADAALPDAEAWVVRRTWIEVRAFPAYQERLELATWCSGTGGHWAERRISVTGGGGGQIEAAVLWVHVDLRTLRPRRIPAGFDELYGEAAGGRRVSAKARHDSRVPAGAARWTWPLRFTDFDVLDHVNNAAYWVPVEEALSVRRNLRAPLRVGVEHRTPLERGAEPEVVVADRGPDGLDLWIVDGPTVAATAQVRPAP